MDSHLPPGVAELMKSEYFLNFVAWMPETLGVPADFIASLEKGDDWTFVIKIHALIEAGLNRAITETINKPELADIISQLDTGDRRYGKLAFAEALEILSDQERGFIRMLSKLRNDLVHKIKNVNFGFGDWLSSKESGARKDIIKTISSGVTATVTQGGKTLSNIQFTERFPRQAILGNAMGIILRVHVWDQKAELARWKEKLATLHLQIAEAKKNKPRESTPTE